MTVAERRAAPRPARGAPWIFAALLAAGCLLRLADLENRPLHGDEAVGALLSAQFRDSGSLLYESSNRHGPFQYFAGGAALAVGGDSTFWIRFPFALAGCLLPLALLPLRRQLTDPGWILAAGLLIFSPSFVYYSRYAIQEIDFALASALFLACGAACAARARPGVIAGFVLSGALMVTIKETFVVVWGCAAIALALGAAAGGPRFRAAVRQFAAEILRRPRILAGVLFGGVLIVTAAYTDFFRSGAGLKNLLRNLAEMIAVGASGKDAAILHAHPPSFYLALLGRYEWLIVSLALAGAWLALRTGRPLALFLTLDAAALTAVHLALPYKTPWLLLTPLLPMAILGGGAGARLLAALQKAGGARLALPAAALLALLPLPRTLLLNFVHPADPVAEPLVYHQTGEEAMQLVREIRATIPRLEAGSFPQAIVCLPYPWPIAWYLKDEPGVLYQRTALPAEPPESLAALPLLVTLDRADPKFLKVFTGLSRVPAFSLPGHVSRSYVLVPPDYVVARLWVRSDLAAPAPGH
ncbi:MAG TPA: flippase activity-associated protein Agl23 [Candidatus Polarisedimenticolia bacterium]|nr:flippase activity-associated protein Agl23 [Candidatus Polarisedimenticolia bacterium]